MTNGRRELQQMEAARVLDRIYESKKKNIKVYPQHVVRASEIGHPCERYLVFSITNWKDKAPHDPSLEFVFEGGRMVEDLAVKDFEEAGFKVYRPEPDKAIMESKPKISGHIDIRVDFGDGKVYTGEIKGLNIIDWDSLNSVQDFFKSKKPWIQKYPAQLMTYLYIKGEERGFFYLKSVPRFQPKLIWVDLDLDYMESILQKTERIENHLNNKTLPEPINNPDMCQKCPFVHVCLPDIKRQAMEFIIDNEFTEMLERHEELKESYKEYNFIDKEIKKRIEGKESVMAGNYLITGKKIQRKGYQVPDCEYWKYDISKLTP